MRNEAPERELSALLARYDAAGGVLDYVFLAPHDAGLPDKCHRAAALAGMAQIDRRLEQYALRFRVRWDEDKLTGKAVTLADFWGSDDVEPKRLGERSWAIPNVDGYKTAFFHPPHGLEGSLSEKAELFAAINMHVLGLDPGRAEIFSWSTDWSSYFEAGHEWWGAFYWTIHPAGSQRKVVLGASSTD